MKKKNFFKYKKKKKIARLVNGTIRTTIESSMHDKNSFILSDMINATRLHFYMTITLYNMILY